MIQNENMVKNMTIELELEEGEKVEDIMIMVIITVRTNKDDIEESFYSLDDAQAYLDNIEDSK